MAYRRQSPKQMQAASPVSVASTSAAPGSSSVAPGSTAAAPGLEPKPAKSRARMMRQYDLVERVRSYNPDTNEDLLNQIGRAHV